MDKKTIKKLRSRGYSVEIAQEGGTFYAHPETGSPVHEDDPDAVKSKRATVYHVEGHGVSSHVADDDPEAWESLLDAAGHKERAKQASETRAETFERLEL